MFAGMAARVDVRDRRLPNDVVRLAAAFSWAGLAAVNVIESSVVAGSIRAVVAVAGFAGPLLVLWFLRPALIGGGDAKLAAAISPLVAWPTATYAFIALLSVSVTALPHAVIAARSSQSLPLGPYIIFGAVIGGVLSLAVT